MGTTRSTNANALQVLRWGALVFGVFYGFTHQQAIHSKDKQAAYQHEYDQKSKLISQAKAKFAEQNAPKNGDGGKSHHMEDVAETGDVCWQSESTTAELSRSRNRFAHTATDICVPTVITNLEDPKFDLEKYLDKVTKENP